MEVVVDKEGAEAVVVALATIAEKPAISRVNVPARAREVVVAAA